jgi:O-antigen/teichoic acid export membrane protein
MLIKDLSIRYKKYIVNTGMYLMASLVSSIVGILVNPLLALNLSPTDYATISYYTSLATFVTPIIGFFLVDFFIREYYKVNKEERELIKGTIFKLLVILQLIISVICILGIAIYVELSHSAFDLMPFAFFSVGSLYFLLPYQLKLAEFKIAGDGKGYAKYAIIWSQINIALQLLFVVVLHFGAAGKLGGTFLYSVLAFIWCFLPNKRYLATKLDSQKLKEIGVYCYPLVLAAILNFFSNGYDKILLERQGCIELLGIYAVGCQIAGYISVFSDSIKSTFQPDMFKAIAEKNIRKVLVAALIVVMGVAILVLLFYLFCPIIIKLLTAGRYIDSTRFARIVCLSALTSSIYYQISQFTYGIGLSKIVLYNKVVCTAVNIVIMYYLVHNFSAIGAAWGMVVGWLVFAVGNIIFLRFNRNKLFN